MEAAAAVLETHAFFRRLPAQRRARLKAAVRHVPKDRYLTTIGDVAANAFLVVTGCFLLKVTTRDGKALLVTLRRPGDWIGLLESLDGGGALFEVCAGCDATVVVFHQAVLKELSDDARFWMEVYPRFVAAHRQVVERLQIGVLGSLRARLAQVLLDFAPEIQGRSPLVLDQGLIAQAVGASRPKVNRWLKLFESAGLITLRRGRVVSLDNPAGLSQLI